MGDLPVSWKAVGVAMWLAALAGAGVAALVFKAEQLVRAAPPERPPVATEAAPFPHSMRRVR